MPGDPGRGLGVRRAAAGRVAAQQDRVLLGIGILQGSQDDVIGGPRRIRGDRLPSVRRPHAVMKSCQVRRPGSRRR